MMRRFGLLLLASLFVLTSADVAAAKGAKKEVEKIRESAPLARAEEISAFKGEFKWGMTTEAVIDKLNGKIDANYEDRSIEAGTNHRKQDQIRGEIKKEKERVARSVVGFDGKKGWWDASIIDEEFVQKNGESMLYYKEPKSTRYFFFSGDSLYKMFVAFDKDVVAGMSFSEFGELMQQKYGKAKPVYRDAPTHGMKDKVLDAFQWRSAEGDGLRLVDRSKFYDVYCLVVYDRSVADRQAEIRKNNAASVHAEIAGSLQRFVIEDSRLTVEVTEHCVTNAEIWKDGKDYRAAGNLERAGGKFLLWCRGARHTWKGISEDIQGGAIRKIESDSVDPLVFILKDDGYVYERGKGRVTLGDGTEVDLPPVRRDNAGAATRTIDAERSKANESGAILPSSFKPQAGQYVVSAADIPECALGAESSSKAKTGPKRDAPFTVKVLADETNVKAAEISLTLLSLGTRSRVAMHSHPKSAELLYLVKGHALFLGPTGVPPVKLDEGAAVFVPAGYPHVIENMGRQSTAVFLQAFSPPGPERVYRDPTDARGRAEVEVIRDPAQAHVPPEAEGKVVVATAADSKPEAPPRGGGNARKLIEGTMSLTLFEWADAAEVRSEGESPATRVFYFISGGGSLKVAGEPQPLPAEAVAYLPRGTTYTMKVAAANKGEKVVAVMFKVQAGAKKPGQRR
jgi:mannose-6-phosphate isomerase-like protein (cupin superfamily)